MRNKNMFLFNTRRCAAFVASVALPTTLVSACTHLVPNDTAHMDVPGYSVDGGVGSAGGGMYDGAGQVDLVVDGAAPPSATKVACSDKPYADPWTPGYTPDPGITSKVQQLVNSMSLPELAQQMRGTDPGNGSNYSDIFRTPDNTNKAIRGFHFRDGPRGVCLAPYLTAGQNGYSTAFPVPEARASAFDMNLEAEVGEAIGDEIIASGNTMVLAPVVNILRHPAWGRAQETYGEDSFVLGRLGSALVTGVQTHVSACVKHYAANNIENGRQSANAEMDEQTLRDVYARHFGVVIRDSGVGCVMAAYNLVNNSKSTTNKHLLTEILRGDLGFQGLVLSDWWAMPPGTSSATTDALKANAIAGVNAGLDMELPWAYNYGQIEAVTGNGAPLSQAQLAVSASRILQQKYRFNVAQLGSAIGLKPATTTFSSAASIENNAAHIALSRQAALESMVLLKNDKNTLPIDRKTVHTVAVIGAQVHYHVVNTEHGDGVINFATDLRLGDLGSSRVFADPAKSSGPFDGIKATAGTGVNVVSGSDPSLASNADFVVVVAGLTPEDEGEEYTGAGDRANFALDGKHGGTAQNTLITQVAAMNKPMVVVIEAGSVIDMPWLAQVPAVVMAWYPGMDGGRALGQLLFGDANFGGKLPLTWPKQWSDEPPFPFTMGTTTHMDYFVGYKYFDHNAIAPLYPFGAGLSYTSFEYKNLQVPCSTVTANGVIDVQVDITNTGAVAGDEVAFLFVSYPNETARRPMKELRGFHRVTLAPKETKRLTMQIRVADLKYWNETSNAWQHATGAMTIMVGSSSANLPLKDTVTLQ